ncbi:MAG: arsenic resistance N-acetyltransferase ArsN2 [Bacteroidota bacterium]|nr:arsenic resistance N-acetyltransferase ArsN2 [Bacteroidota bacterium]
METATENLQLKHAKLEDLPLIKDLLLKENLPASDIVMDIIHIFLFYDKKNLVGMTGLENFREHGLLRSVVVVDEFKGKGKGKTMCMLTMEKALEMGVEELYLLTETAEDFFKSQGFETVNKEEAPGFIKSTTEFKNLCPASAAFMRKNLLS